MMESSNTNVMYASYARMVYVQRRGGTPALSDINLKGTVGSMVIA